MIIDCKITKITLYSFIFFKSLHTTSKTSNIQGYFTNRVINQWTTLVQFVNEFKNINLNQDWNETG